MHRSHSHSAPARRSLKGCVLVDEEAEAEALLGCSGEPDLKPGTLDTCAISRHAEADIDADNDVDGLRLELLLLLLPLLHALAAAAEAEEAGSH